MTVPVLNEPGDIRALAAALRQTGRPLGEARTLPGAAITSPSIFALESDRLFARSWLAVARESDLPQAGCFVTHETAGERMLVVRGEDGVLRAFYNVCRHRGSRLVEQAQGRLRGAIACPYHAWSYSLDGRLRRAPHMDASAHAHSLALASMPLATRDGFVFVNLDPDAQPLDRSLAELPDLAAFRLDTLARAGGLEYEVAANWKVVCENYSECYHCPLVHPQLDRLSEVSSGGFESGACFNGGPMRIRPGFQTLSLSGRSAWARLCGNDIGGLVRYYLVYPNLMLGIHPDYLLVHRVWPLDAQKSRVTCELLVAPQSLAAPDFDASEVLAFWDLTNKQDWSLCERVQRGVASRGYRPGPYHASERCVHAFDRWYAQWLLQALCDATDDPSFTRCGARRPLRDSLSPLEHGSKRKRKEAT